MLPAWELRPLPRWSIRWQVDLARDSTEPVDGGVRRFVFEFMLTTEVQLHLNDKRPSLGPYCHEDKQVLPEFLLWLREGTRRLVVEQLLA